MAKIAKSYTNSTIVKFVYIQNIHGCNACFNLSFVNSCPKQQMTLVLQAVFWFHHQALHSNMFMKS